MSLRERRHNSERFGCGVFMCRPVRLQCLDFKFSKDAAATLVTGWTVHSVAELRRAPELVAMADWLRSGDEDFFACPDAVTAAFQVANEPRYES